MTLRIFTTNDALLYFCVLNILPHLLCLKTCETLMENDSYLDCLLMIISILGESSLFVPTICPDSPDL